MENSLIQDLSILKNLPKDWAILPFNKVIQDVTGGNIKTLKSEFQGTGLIPVIDQGKELIAGYVDDESAIVKTEKPYIIFGDHTRVLKYIDFKFAMGADGTKVLKVKPGVKAIEKYVYYFFKTLNIPETGYNRHFKYLKDSVVPLPDLPTQQKMAALLDKADELRQYNKQLIEKYDALTQSLFLDMFGDPVRNEKGFPKTTVRNLCDEVKYGTSAKSDGSGKWSYLRMNNITYSGHMDFSDVKSINVSEKDFVKYSVKKGDVLFNRTNSKELVGKTGIITNDDTYIIAGYLIRVRVNRELANPYFLWAHLNSKWAKLTLSNMCKNIVGMANINAQELQDILILQPPVTLQNQFAERVQLIEQQKELAQQALQKSEELFNSLLQKAFKGELVPEYEL